MRTREGVSSVVAAGDVWFTLLGFMGMYAILGILFLFLVYREIEHGPGSDAAPATNAVAVAAAD
jgi:cytochrome d ubiquinol oxidase subunit I